MYFWKGIKVFYRCNFVEFFEEGYVFVIMVVLVCKVYEVWFVYGVGWGE